MTTPLLIPAILAGLLVYVAAAAYVAGVVARRFRTFDSRRCGAAWPIALPFIAADRVCARIYRYGLQDPAERRAARLERRQAKAQRADFAAARMVRK